MIDFLKKIINSDKFRKACIQFLNTGSYCSYPPGTTEYYQFWDDEMKKCLDGYEADDGDYITGYNYFYLNYCPINRQVWIDTVNRKGEKIRKKEQRFEFPDFWDYDYFYFSAVEEASEQGKHLCVLKSRRKGYSFKAAAMMCRNYYLIPSSKSYVYASNKLYLTEDGVLTKAWDYMDFIDKNTAWGKKRSVDTALRKRAGFTVKDEYGKEVEMGYKSEIIGVTLKDNPDIVRGKKANLILFEEAGSFKELGAAWQIARPSVEIDEVAFAPMIAYGTGGDEGCITENNFVYTTDGNQISIKDICKNDKLIGYDIKNKNVTEEPIQFINTPTKKECVLITTNSGRTIECSVDHPILSSMKTDYNGCLIFDWNSAQELKQNNYLAIAKQIPYFGKNIIKNARSIGIFIGDGSYRNNSSVRLTSCDDEILELVKKLYPCSILRSRITKDGRRLEELLVKKAKYDINALGISGQTKDKKRLPEILNSCDKHSIAELLGGLYDTDGCVSTTYNKVRNKYSTIINLTQSSKVLLQQVLLLLQKFGIRGYIYKVSKPLSKNSVCKNKNYISCYYSLDIHDKNSIINFYKNIHFIVKYKQQRLKEAAEYYCTQKSLQKDRGFYYEKIVSVENVGYKTIYNITAGNSHTYLVNGIITHNSNFQTLKDMFYNPDGYNCLALDNIWDEAATNKCGFFIPQYANIDVRDDDGNRIYMDKDGNTLKEQSILYILHNRQKVIESATNASAIDRYVAERPITPKEAMLEFNGNIFPKKEILEQLSLLRTNKNLKNYKLVGDLDWDKDGLLIWTPKKTGDITHYPLKNGDDPTGSIVIWEHPNKEASAGLYIGGLDSYDFDSSGTTSLGSCFIYKRTQNLEQYSDIIVAEYTGRPATAEIFYENVRKLLVYYNATLMYENQNKGVFAYFTQKHCDYLLADQPDIINDVISNSKVLRKKGCHMNKLLKQWGEGLIKDWLNDLDKTGKKNVYNILSEPLLEELLAYSENTNTDRCILEDTRISTSEGFKQAKDIKLGDKLLTHNGINRTVSYIDKHVYSGNIVQLRLQGDYRVLTCTGNHPIYVGYSKFKSHYFRKDAVKYPEWVRADCLNYKYQFALLPKRKGLANIDLSDDVLYLLGWVMSDGYIAKDSNTVRITYQINQLDCAKKCLNIIEDYLVDEKYYFSKNGKRKIDRKPVKIFRYKNCWRLEVASKKLHDLCKWFGCNPNNKCISHEIYTKYINLMPFVIGWLEGDGHQRLNCNYDGHTRNGIELSTIYEELLHQCRQILIDHGIYASVRKIKTRGNYRDQYSILISNEFVNKVLNYYNSLKFVKILVSKNTCRCIETKDGFWTPIKLLNIYQDTTPVINFEVDTDHSYIAEGIAVHNCMAVMQLMIYREQLYNIVVKEKTKINKSRLLFDGPIFAQNWFNDDPKRDFEDNVYTF